MKSKFGALSSLCGDRIALNFTASEQQSVPSGEIKRAIVVVISAAMKRRSYVLCREVRAMTIGGWDDALA